MRRSAPQSQASASGGTTDLGGNDTITSLEGSKVVLGGDAADTVSLATGDHTVLGDNGTVTYVALGQTGAGLALTYETTAHDWPGRAAATRSRWATARTPFWAAMAPTRLRRATAPTRSRRQRFCADGCRGHNYAQIGTESQASASRRHDRPGRSDTDQCGVPARKIVLGGDGADTVMRGRAARATISCSVDNGTLTYVALGATGAACAALRDDRHISRDGRDDTITLDDGDNVILGGMGVERDHHVQRQRRNPGDNGMCRWTRPTGV